MEKSQNTFEAIGFVKKLELISTIEDKIIPDTFVVESTTPFPGYHGDNLPSETKPGLIFFITKEPYSSEIIARASQKIKKYFQEQFGALYGNLNFYNEDFPCIRIKNLTSFDYIADLQSCFRDEGIKFMKKKKVNTNSILKFQKYFILGRLDGNDFLKDLEEEAIMYFRIENHLKWKLFEQITKFVKNNVENNNFDAALASLFSFEGMNDYIRIYSEFTIQQLKGLCEKYKMTIEKFT